MTIFATGHSQVNPTEGSQGASSAVAQELLHMMVGIMIAQMEGMGPLYRSLITASDYQQGTAGILAILNGSENPRDWDLFGQYYPWLLQQMNNPNCPKGLRSFLKSILNKPHWRNLFDKLHKDIYNLQLAENSGNKAEIKKCKKTVTNDIVAVRKGNNVVPPNTKPKDKTTPAELGPTSAEWKKMHARWLEEYQTAKNVAAETKATAMVLYERSMRIINTVISLARFTSAEMKQNQNILENEIYNAGS